MVEFALPKNSQITKGRHYPAPEGATIRWELRREKRV